MNPIETYHAALRAYEEYRKATRFTGGYNLREKKAFLDTLKSQATKFAAQRRNTDTQPLSDAQIEMSRSGSCAAHNLGNQCGGECMRPGRQSLRTETTKGE